MRNIVAIILLVILLGVLLNSGLNNYAKHECLVWSSYAERYPNFYLNPAEAQQCKAVGIEVKAPVK